MDPTPRPSLVVEVKMNEIVPLLPASLGDDPKGAFKTLTPSQKQKAITIGRQRTILVSKTIGNTKLSSQCVGLGDLTNPPLFPTGLLV